MLARIFDQQWNMYLILIKRRHRMFHQAMVPDRFPMVRGYDDQGILIETAPFQLQKEFPNLRIDISNAAVILRNKMVSFLCCQRAAPIHYRQPGLPHPYYRVTVILSREKLIERNGRQIRRVRVHVVEKQKERSAASVGKQGYGLVVDFLRSLGDSLEL